MITQYFTALHDGEEARGFTAAAQRLGMLIAQADLRSISKSNFILLCRLLNGLLTEGVFDSKDMLLSTIASGLSEKQESRLEIAGRHFPGDTPESRAAFMREFDEETERLGELYAIVERLEAGTAVALLYRIDEVYAGEGDDILARAEAVYRKIEARDRL